MPVASRAKWARLKVGLMTIVALAILGALIFLMAGSKGLFKSKTDLYTYMGDSAAIADGAPVRLNGIYVGRVTRVTLSGSSEPRRVVKVDLKIDGEFLPSIPIDSQATIAAENLLGTKYINIKKGRSAQTVKPGAEIESLDTSGFDDVVQQGYTALSSLQGIFKKLDGVLDAITVGQGTIGKLLVDETLYNRVLAIADEAQKLTLSLNATLNARDSTIGKLLHEDQLYQDARGSLARIDALMDSLSSSLDQGQGTVGKLLKDPALYDDTRATIADVRQLLAGINSGQGTVGKLLKSDDLHDQLQATIGRLDTLLDKINNSQGTIGQLLANPALYESLDGTTRELQGLLKDFRSNPKKFLKIQLHLF
jgi:phospholipid/cholesterol/gamma-HCH transport system substrate-binding protein